MLSKSYIISVSSNTSLEIQDKSREEKEEQQINKFQIDFKFTVLSVQRVPKVRLVKIKKTNFFIYVKWRNAGRLTI